MLGRKLSELPNISRAHPATQQQRAMNLLDYKNLLCKLRKMNIAQQEVLQIKHYNNLESLFLGYLPKELNNSQRICACSGFMSCLIVIPPTGCPPLHICSEGTRASQRITFQNGLQLNMNQRL